MKFADLHLHTYFSDGTYSPGELVAQAKKQGLSAIAVADHDTVAGIDPLLREAEAAAGLEVLPCIEVTAQHEGLEVHILGYLVDHHDAGLIERLGTLKENRIERVYKIAERLKRMGVELDPESVFSLAQRGTVGRLHIARALVKAGVTGSTAEAFRKYIGDRAPAYVCGFRFTPQDAIGFIKAAGGIPVLAHPYTLGRDEVIAKLVECGLMGLEAYYPEHTRSMTDTYLKLARQLNILVTGGSDCHGDGKPEVKLGSIKIPYELVEKLKEKKEGIA